MGTEMRAFIEYDDQYFPASPFSNIGNINCLTRGVDGLNTGSKCYVFFAAVAGIRSETNQAPLFVPRGVPVPISPVLARASEHWDFNEAGFGIGWLYLREIKEALNYASLSEDDINTEILAILDVMTVLERRLGVDHVRLIFSFD